MSSTIYTHEGPEQALGLSSSMACTSCWQFWMAVSTLFRRRYCSIWHDDGRVPPSRYALAWSGDVRYMLSEYLLNILLWF